ncbi:MAG: DUF4115 domain-containing protein [Armatimonadetes bacterium]|nr:DUF4115 domain-containing protein [Armatimonadota bacterium]
MENTDNIGNVLKKERESRGLSFKEVQDATKITIQNLSALEEDRFDAFPNRVYSRAFLRDYANYLGLDSDALLTRYESSLINQQETVIAPPPRLGSAWKFVGRLALTLIVVGAVAAGGYYYYDKSCKDAADLQDAGLLVPRMPAVVTPPTVSTPPAGPAIEPTTPAAPDKLTLQVAALQDVWLRIVADGKKVYEGILPQGGIKTWEAKKVIFIRTGKAGGVQLKLNGVTQPSLGPLRTPANKEFKMPVVTTPPTAPIAPSAAPKPPRLNRG